jgi:hypothetical protein
MCLSQPRTPVRGFGGDSAGTAQQALEDPLGRPVPHLDRRMATIRPISADP